MTERRVTQEIAEVASEGLPNRRVSQAIAEVAWSLNPNRELTQVIAEFAWTPPPAESLDVLSTVATLDHDLIVGMEPDQHHDEIHPLDETVHTGGLLYKTGVSPTISDADYDVAVNGMVAFTYNIGNGIALYWVRSAGSWKSVSL